MKNFDLAKFEGFTQLVSVIMKIVNILLYMALGILSLAGVVLSFIPQKSISDMMAHVVSEVTTDLILSGVSVSISPSMLDATKLKAPAIGLILLSFFAVAVILLIVKCVRKILEQVLAKEPFNDKSCHATKQLALLYLLSGILFATFSNLSTLLATKMLGLDKILTGSQMVETVSSSIFALDGGMLLTGFLILLLAKIFEYGAYLQNEVDQIV